ncbi:DUF2793 domain-containing protein [Prosthecomicrobium sp. N25]|uniref:DUF2793 domain-containing protein n=1 Tax=Prosthecomicrobium sp. N25 TaxID=3129254 RepID=UPI0030781C66
MTVTPRLALPLIEAAQAQKHVTHNEALDALDALVQAVVQDRDLAAPPSSPAEGNAWIVAAAPTGAWAGRAGQIAVWLAGAWTFLPPGTGWRVWVADEARLFVWTGSVWQDLVAAALAATTALQNVALLGIGTTADATNPLAAKINKALFSARRIAEGGTGDLRATIDKEAATRTGSILFQTNFSGRGEIGLVGTDDLSLRVSPDGSTWTEALRCVAATGEAVTRMHRPDTDNARTLGTASFRWSQVYAATATINTSDARDKLDVADLALGLDFVRRLRPVSFRYRVAETGPEGPREGRRRHAGFLAQEVRAALGPEDSALWTEDAASGRQGLRYEELVPVLARAVQELDARLSALARRP